MNGVRPTRAASHYATLCRAQSARAELPPAGMPSNDSAAARRSASDGERGRVPGVYSFSGRSLRVLYVGDFDRIVVTVEAVR